MSGTGNSRVYYVEPESLRIWYIYLSGWNPEAWNVETLRLKTKAGHGKVREYVGPCAA